MISCLMVTQAGRERYIETSLACFKYQSFAQRELVIVHDADADFDAYLHDLRASYSALSIRVVKGEAGLSLGALRNLSLETASYPYVCQWDDDDLYHPERLTVQFEAMQAAGSDFCFLTDQLHWFVEQNFLFWDDWSIEKYPGNLIQGTLLGKKSLMGNYPLLTKGEDTPMVHSLAASNQAITTVRDYAWLYIYRFHGNNAWDESHHKAISNFKRLNQRELSKRMPELRKRLTEYGLGQELVYFPHDQGKFALNPNTGELSDCN